MTDRRLITVDAGTLVIDPEAIVEPVDEGFRVSAPWYDGSFETAQESRLAGADINAILAAHVEHLAKRTKKTPQPVYRLADF